MSYCNHFRDFLVLSSADLTRLTLVDLDFVPAPGCQQKNKSVRFLENLAQKFRTTSSARRGKFSPLCALSLGLDVETKIKTQHKQESHAQTVVGELLRRGALFARLPSSSFSCCHTHYFLVVILPDDGQKDGDEHFFPAASSSSASFLH